MTTTTMKAMRRRHLGCLRRCVMVILLLLFTLLLFLFFCNALALRDNVATARAQIEEACPPQPHLTAGRRRRRRGRTRFISRGTQPRDGILNGFAYFAMLCSLDLETLYHKTRVRFRVRLLAPHGGIIDSRRQTFLMLEKSAQDEESNFSAKIPWPGDFPWVLY